MTKKAKQLEIETRDVEELEGEEGPVAEPARRKVKVVELQTGAERELAGDTPTRDARTLSHFSYPSGAVLPLVIRPPDAVFYVCGHQYSELFGKLVRRAH